MRGVRPTFACLLAALTLSFLGLTLSLGGPALAQTPSPQTTVGEVQPRDQIVLSGDVMVPQGDEVGEVVVLHGTVTVAGVVRGDVIVVDGSISVMGQVSGSVVSVNGPVTLGPNAQVLGDVIARDRIRVQTGASVGGDVREGAAFTFRTPIDVFGPFAAWLAVVVSTLLLGALLLFLAPRGAEALAGVALGSPWPTAGLGLAAFIALPVAGVLAVLTLVGLPLGLGLLLGLFLLYSVGFAWSEFVVGRALWRAPRSPWVAFAIGWGIVAAISAIPVVGAIVWFAGASFGLGAMTIASWRARGAGGRHRWGGKMPAERSPVEPAKTSPEPMVTERTTSEGSGT
jgi:cytoskeletal protein CcmA (bactofilin family)